ncbi:MAG TPA: ATP-dependent Clp protease proteolytic subunit [Verrucomicrobiae bacterium]|jgi:ATP-dependent protease ClpP protease subunit
MRANSPLERQCVTGALRRHYTELMMADGPEIKTWALAANSASWSRSKPWFTVKKGPSCPTVNISGEIGVGDLTADNLLAILDGVSEINLCIDSTGGDTDCAMRLWKGFGDLVSLCTIIGRCYSAAVILAMSARKIQIAHDGRMMLHPPRAAVFAPAGTLRECADSLDGLSGRIVDTIQKRTGQPTAVVEGWLSKGTFFGASEAVSLRLADAVIAEDSSAPLTSFPVGDGDLLTEDEREFREFMGRFEAVNVRDPDKFLRSMFAWLVHKVRQA